MTVIGFGKIQLPRMIVQKTQTLIGASKEVGLGVNAEKTKYMLLSRHQNAGQNLDIKIANRYSEIVAQSIIWEQQ
jgi:hypothetical protein